MKEKSRGLRPSDPGPEGEAAQDSILSLEDIMHRFDRKPLFERELLYRFHHCLPLFGFFAAQPGQPSHPFSASFVTSMS